MAYVGKAPANAALTASDIGNGIITAEKLAANSVTTAKVTNVNITSGKIANDAITNAKTEFTPGLTIKGDGSSADGKLILNCSQNSHGVSTVADVSQTIAPATATTINITGSNFVLIPQVQFINGTTGAILNANTVSLTNTTTLSVNCTLATGNYYVRVENPDGNAGRSTNNIITASTAPSFTTAAGSLGSVAGNFSGTVFTVVGSSDSAISFSEVTSVLVGSGSNQANCSLATNGVITTSDFGGSSTAATLYQFTLRITDAEGQTADRVFSLQSSFGATGGGQFN
jgi:hypothetical protein